MKEYMKEMYRVFFIRGGNVNSIRIKMMAQAEYCKDNDVPHFAPGNGICWACRKQIYNKIDFVKAANALVTGCPYCCYSYCG